MSESIKIVQIIFFLWCHYRQMSHRFQIMFFQGVLQHPAIEMDGNANI